MQFSTRVPFFIRNVHSDPLQPLNFFLMDNDVVPLVKRTYPGIKRMEIAGNKSAMEIFFGSAAKGKTILSNVAEEEWEDI